MDRVYRDDQAVPTDRIANKSMVLDADNVQIERIVSRVRARTFRRTRVASRRAMQARINTRERIIIRLTAR